ncbi:hypothetical protein ACIBJC_24275 [Streptomyces sp. NPDC050509]|uniref:hypothetical protein n=1 Tax=Streptomyces sp. NPDC050509 TaxID=3365620 RepID=UPI0037947B63
MSQLQMLRERIVLRRERDAAVSELEKVRQELIANELRILDDGVLFERIFGSPPKAGYEE